MQVLQAVILHNLQTAKRYLLVETLREKGIKVNNARDA